MSKTYNPKKIKRQRKHGFLKRVSSKGGSAVILRRRRKNRYKLTV
ncbi:MAG: 50S ribosomal protein L34 [Candidatus Azambacteria bacterium]|nr:50S ribosomal protein L34 [Candidatus Azambacteria bacterium]